MRGRGFHPKTQVRSRDYKFNENASIEAFSPALAKPLLVAALSKLKRNNISCSFYLSRFTLHQKTQSEQAILQMKFPENQPLQ